VAALAGARVSHAACGVWHTAAVAAPRPGGCAAAALSSLGALERRVVRMQQAAAFELLAEVRLQSCAGQGSCMQRACRRRPRSGAGGGAARVRCAVASARAATQLRVALPSRSRLGFLRARRGGGRGQMACAACTR